MSKRQGLYCPLNHSVRVDVRSSECRGIYKKCKKLHRDPGSRQHITEFLTNTQYVLVESASIFQKHSVQFVLLYGHASYTYCINRCRRHGFIYQLNKSLRNKKASVYWYGIEYISYHLYNVHLMVVLLIILTLRYTAISIYCISPLSVKL